MVEISLKACDECGKHEPKDDVQHFVVVQEDVHAEGDLCKLHSAALREFVVKYPVKPYRRRNRKTPVFEKPEDVPIRGR